MNIFNHINATSIEQAVSALQDGKSAPLAGGTATLAGMRLNISASLPETLVNIKGIAGLDYIKEESGMLKIGALTKLTDVYRSSVVKSKYAALAEAAHKVGTPELRNMGTVGGNICQGVRCWYYRSPNNSFNCLRKNTNGVCQALVGDNRYHSIFGAMSGCVAVSPSDLGPALVAFQAKIVTTKQTVDAEEFFTVNGEKTTILDQDEIVKEIQIPAPAAGAKSVFLKFALRKSFDFALASVAVVRNGASGRICLGGVYNVPRRAQAAEAALPDAEAAANAAVNGATALPKNAYKIQITKTLVKRAVEATA